MSLITTTRRTGLLLESLITALLTSAGISLPSLVRIVNSTGPEERRQELLSYVRQPEVQSLLALGDQAHVRYYDTESRYRAQGDGVVEQVYAVTYQEAGQRKSFFVRLTLRRHHVASTGRAYWQVENHEVGIRPKAMGPEKDGRAG